jgi:hypothetical protein
VGDFQIGRIRRTMPLLVWGKEKAKMDRLLKPTRAVLASRVQLSPMQRPVGQVADAERAVNLPERCFATFANGIYDRPIEKDWAEELYEEHGGEA